MRGLAEEAYLGMGNQSERDGEIGEGVERGNCVVLGLLVVQAEKREGARRKVSRGRWAG